MKRIATWFRRRMRALRDYFNPPLPGQNQETIDAIVREPNEVRARASTVRRSREPTDGDLRALAREQRETPYTRKLRRTS